MTHGVDTVGIAFPIHRADTTGATATVANYGTSDPQVKFRRKLPGGGFMAWGVGTTCWVEASLPKRQGPDNVTPVGLTDAVELLRGLHAEALEHCDPAAGTVYLGRERWDADGRDFAQVALKRLDVVRDFDGVAVGPVLDGLAGQHRTGRCKVRRFADAEHGNSETLRVGVRSAWSCVLYDKHAETSGIAPPGRLRFEARLRDSFLTGSLVRERYGHAVPTLGALEDLGELQLRDLGRERFVFVGFNRHVHGTSAFAEIVNASELTPRTKRELCAFLASEALGVDLQWSDPTRRKYRRLAAHLGITIGTRVAPEVTVGLDFDAGGQVFHVGHPDGDLEPPGSLS